MSSCRTLEDSEGKERAASEMADLLYHALVLLMCPGNRRSVSSRSGKVKPYHSERRLQLMGSERMRHCCKSLHVLGLVPGSTSLRYRASPVCRGLCWKTSQLSCAVGLADLGLRRKPAARRTWLKYEVDMGGSIAQT